MHGRPKTLVRVASFERRDPVYPYPLDAEVTQKRAERVHTTPEARVPKNFETSLSVTHCTHELNSGISISIPSLHSCHEICPVRREWFRLNVVHSTHTGDASLLAARTPGSLTRRYLTALERDAPQEWQGRFIQYKKLKKMLKACLVVDETDDDVDIDGEDSLDERPYMIDTDREDEFFNELEAELQCVNKHFFDKADRTVARYQRRTRGVLAFVLKPIFAFHSVRSLNQLAKDAYWCRKYARANAVALRKILKKHDKTCKNRRGKVFLQECWALSGPDGIGLFLHSPLLDELKAVQEKLQMALDAAGNETVVADPNADTNEVYPLHPEDPGEEGGRGGRSIATGTSLSVSRRDICLEEGEGGEEIEGDEHAADEEDNAEEDDDAARRRRIYRMSVDERSGSGSVARDGFGDGQMPLSIVGTEDPTVYTHSLDASRRDALLAIEQATTCLLDSSDVEWEDDTPLHSEDEMGASDWPVPTVDGTFVDRSRITAKEKEDTKEDTKEKKVIKKRSLGKETYKRGVDPDTLGFSPSKVTLPNATASRATSIDVIGSIEGQTNDHKTNTRPSNSNNESSMAGASATYDESDFKCPICLELMYRPVGLSCGHKFCRQCALDAAGFGKVFGAFRNIISYIPARVTCPECRQAKAYKGAVSLKELGFLIRDRFPKEYAERRDEERENRRNVALRPAEPLDPGRPLYPFDILHI